MSSTPPDEPIPSDGERNAVVGFSAQYALAAKVVSTHLSRLEWIRLADPKAGVADDFQFSTSGRRHALQVKWSQYPGSFTWSDFAGSSGRDEALLTQLARAWKRIRAEWDGALTVHLCTNNFPSTTPGRGAQALARVAASPKHLAGFISRGLEPLAEHLRLNPDAKWIDVQALDFVTEWEPVWDELVTVSELATDDFGDFLRDFSFTFVAHDQPALATRRDDSDLAHLAATLQALVADPARVVEFDRSELLRRLGWTQRLKYQNPHRFPVPTTYTVNRAAKSALERQIDEHLSGYLALIGPAGSGKSTLIESLSVSGRIIKYYAFVPDAPDPLSGRGEATSFLHDLSLALEDGGILREGFGSDLSGQRFVLMDQIERAGRRYAEEGIRTTIIVDGLDHIPREQNPTRSLLEELPAPAAIPPGVVFLLGTQTIEILPATVRDALDQRVVEVPPLSTGEIRGIAKLAGLEEWMLPGHIDELVGVSEGHPLALTYLIEGLRQLEDVADDEARRNLVGRLLRDSSDLGTNLDTRYSHYLGSVLEDPDVSAILGSICRLRIPVQIEWLSTWSNAAAVSRFASAASTFFRRHDGEWTFIHNSFRRFLVNETAKVGGTYQDWRSQQLHQELAERCAQSAGWVQYKDEELVQRFLAGQLDRVLEASTPKILREGLFAGRPHGVVRDMALVAVRASADAKDYAALVRSLMFLNELNQRHYVLDSNAVAKTMAVVDPRATLEHVVQGRTLRIDSAPAMEVASALAEQGFLQDAEKILLAQGGLQGLIGDRARLGGRLGEWVAAISDWAEVTWRQSGPERVLDELDHILPVPVNDAPQAANDEGSEPEDWQVERAVRDGREARDAIRYARDLVHARCFDLADEVRDQTGKAQLAERISSESNLDWRARMHVVSARSALEDGDAGEVLRQAKQLLAIERGQRDATPAGRSLDSAEGSSRVRPEEDEEDESPVRRPMSLAVRVAVAESLLRSGHGATDEFAELFPADTRAAWPTSVGSSDGLAPYRTALATLRLRFASQRLDLYPPGTTKRAGVPSPDSDPARARFVAALECMAGLEADAIVYSLGAAAAPDVAAMSDPVVRLLEVPSSGVSRK